MRITRGHLILALMLATSAAFWVVKRRFASSTLIPVSALPEKFPVPAPPASPLAPVEENLRKEVAKPVAKKAVPMPAPTASPKAKVGRRIHIVRRGESLWVISRRYYGKGKLWTEIYKANHARIKNPRKIYAGQRLQIPSV